jgi:hypothetical protein
LGLYTEFGPWRVGAQNKLLRNPFAWTTLASIVFLEQPVGVGFSYSTTPVAAQGGELRTVLVLLALFVLSSSKLVYVCGCVFYYGSSDKYSFTVVKEGLCVHFIFNGCFYIFICCYVLLFYFIGCNVADTIDYKKGTMTIWLPKTICWLSRHSFVNSRRGVAARST